MTPEQLKKLRDRKPLKLFDSQNRQFIHFQLNNKEKFICWERWTSKDRFNWVKQNCYLSLKDIKTVTTKISQYIKDKNQLTTIN